MVGWNLQVSNNRKVIRNQITSRYRENIASCRTNQKIERMWAKFNKIRHDEDEFAGISPKLPQKGVRNGREMLFPITMLYRLKVSPNCTRFRILTPLTIICMDGAWVSVRDKQDHKSFDVDCFFWCSVVPRTERSYNDLLFFELT